jgi:outer membrane protein
MTTETTTPASQESKGTSWLNYSALINLLLFAGLIILYGLYFFGLDRATTDVQEQQLTTISEKVEAATSSFAYIDSERLMEEYQLAEKMREDFDAEQRRLEADLTRRQRNFQNEVERFQRDISTGAITSTQAQVKEQELMQMQQDLMQLNDTYTTQLARKELEMNNELFETISAFLERFNREKGFDFILSFSRGGNLLFAKDQHDITDQVLSQLNAEFTAENR